MIKCPACSKKISDTAPSCPKCGHPVTPQEREQARSDAKTKNIAIAVLVAVVVLWGVFGDNNDRSGSSRSDSSPTIEIRQDRIENGFSAWDGSHRSLTRFIKQVMNDPDSYEHVETVYWDKGDHLIVKTTFRGNNAYGGKVVNWVKAKVDLDGNVLEVIEQGP